jgi:hypothetical protein
MARHIDSELENRIRQARARVERVYRRLGEHLKACQALSAS